MNRPIANFFIMQQRTQDVFAFKTAQRGQPSDGPDGAFNSRAIDVRKFFERPADARSSDHPIANGFAMLDSRVVRGSLQAMPDGVSKIQNPPEIALLLIVHHNIRLYRGATCNQTFNSFRIAFPKQLTLALELVEQLRIANNTVLERFEKPARVFALG